MMTLWCLTPVAELLATSSTSSVLNNKVVDQLTLFPCRMVNAQLSTTFTRAMACRPQDATIQHSVPKAPPYSIIDHPATLFIHTSNQHRTTSPNVHDILGYELEELAGRAGCEFMSPGDHSRCQGLQRGVHLIISQMTGYL
ncbi:hypothetical protein B0O80DRAFT_173927 [Mortierella sp. GBAus27b]|nr:hypothetical protein B0O80DRAFT_173927 [Mortierella sp. GBAus27b]